MVYVDIAVTYLSLRLADPNFRLAGRTRIQVLGRVRGLVLARIATRPSSTGCGPPAWRPQPSPEPAG